MDGGEYDVAAGFACEIEPQLLADQRLHPAAEARKQNARESKCSPFWRVSSPSITRLTSHKRMVRRCGRDEHRARAPRYDRGFGRLLCGGVAAAEWRVVGAQRSFEAAAVDFTLSESQHGAMRAQYRLAQLTGRGDRLDVVRGWFAARGVIDRDKWVWAMPHSVSGALHG